MLEEHSDLAACSIVMTAKMEVNVTYELLAVLANQDSQDFSVTKRVPRGLSVKAVRGNASVKMAAYATQ